MKLAAFRLPSSKKVTTQKNIIRVLLAVIVVLAMATGYLLTKYNEVVKTCVLIKQEIAKTI